MNNMSNKKICKQINARFLQGEKREKDSRLFTLKDFENLITRWHMFFYAEE